MTMMTNPWIFSHPKTVRFWQTLSKKHRTSNDATRMSRNEPFDGKRTWARMLAKWNNQRSMFPPMSANK